MLRAIAYSLISCLLAGCASTRGLLPFAGHSKAWQPSPADGSKGVSPDTQLRWNTPQEGATFRVHFGTRQPPPFVGTAAEAHFDPGPLDWDTTYYWRVDVDGSGEGNVWRFTTFWYGDPEAEEMDVRLEEGGGKGEYASSWPPTGNR
jgi:hypothetical protein